MSHFPLSRAMGAATAAYAVYALARPGHLTRALQAPTVQEPALDRLARTYGVRDLASTALLFTGDTTLVRAGMALRIAGDLGDCLILGTTTADPAVRRKVVGTTLGWATLNAAAWLTDERGADS
jgi:hypothetical protein